MKFIQAVLVASVLAAVAASCQSKSSPGPSVSGVTVTGNSTFANKNQTSQLTATANFSSGSPQDVTSQSFWSTSNASIATVTSSGLVTAVGNGTATITATYQNVPGTLSVTITLKADPQVSGNFVRLCSPFQARLEVTVAEASGNAGMNITALTLVMKDFFGVARVTKTYTPAELSAGFGGSAHFNALQSKVLILQSAYPGNVDTSDSKATIDASFTDDFGNTKTIHVDVNFQHDGC